MEERSSEGEIGILESVRGIFRNMEYWKGLCAKYREIGFSRNYFAKEKLVERVRGPGAPGVATLGRAAVGHQRPTEIGLWWPRVPRGLAGSERENWGTRPMARRSTGRPWVGSP
jgi:hypothetical protein